MNDFAFNVTIITNLAYDGAVSIRKLYFGKMFPRIHDFFLARSLRLGKRAAMFFVRECLRPIINHRCFYM
jgi:hypothetical protein